MVPVAGRAASAEKGGRVRYRLTVKGTVQGVGFRPFVYHLAVKYGLKGFVRNDAQGVYVEVEGGEEEVKRFCKELCQHPPRLARIAELLVEVLPPAGYSAFEIDLSRAAPEKEALVPPDVAICPDCAREIFDPEDRHYLYPFTNCTNCGPRFTIVRELPYDRARTSMASFPMCPDCSREYHDPLDRRFHAQPVACPRCGPQLKLFDAQGRSVEGDWRENCWELLRAGKILAIKGLGGFHLCCDALEPRVVALLRRRKRRPHKPLAVMARDLEVVRRFCELGPVEEELLTSPAAPIVVLKRRPEAGLPEELAPGLKTLGVMLPYTPLHLLLLQGPLPLLVMTSGNRSGLPLCKDNERAWEELGDIADYFLIHNRDIVNRCDDSVVAVMGGIPAFYRRSRGYVPQPVKVPAGEGPVVLGIGGEMKNTFCLLRRGEAFLSQHIGELDTVEGEENLKTSLESFTRLLGVKPEVVGYDLHPDYRSSRLARELEAKYRFAVQHHHAHMASCLAENGAEGPAVGAILDGTGYGTDGCLWGFEILTGDFSRFERHYHLAYTPLPGGEAAIKHPWRIAVSYLLTFLGEEGREWSRRLFGAKGQELSLLEKIIAQRVNAPLACGCGRLFDAVAALLGVRWEISYEGQAAIELGEMALPPEEGKHLPPYPFAFEGEEISPAPLFREILADLARGEDKRIISTRFHNTVVAMVREAVARVVRSTGLATVVLSGGSWQNPYLFVLGREALEELGLKVLHHRQVPANDGGLCLGQAAIAYKRWWEECA
ncbi:(NiFe) hydrogenase maturation protein HypF [Ammonifex degensii KC4]|uniref:Carbamoyltransferase n=1 Tax=Ammonifex degensii (strain DSM 10501 / KC4) TaxID=429009 RepID=C9R9V8_AMMDK|nr:(NiFe) hydrogenase maturation protein HypF [Ammonifex degensii KC4]